MRWLFFPVTGSTFATDSVAFYYPIIANALMANRVDIAGFPSNLPSKVIGTSPRLLNLFSFGGFVMQNLNCVRKCHICRIICQSGTPQTEFASAGFLTSQ